MLTYRELNRRANQVAHHLIRQGVGPEVLVGVYMERSMEMMVGLLGIFKAGGAYVPMDPAYPAERLSMMLDDARIRLILSQSHLRPRIPECHGRFIFLDGNETVFRAEGDDNPASPCKPENLAYVIFTSGSTGKPKGVAVEHASVAALIAWSGETYSSEQLSGVLASSSICFDISVFELFSTLCLGGKVVLVKNLLDLPEMRHADQVTLINTVPSAFEGLLQLSGIPKSVGTVNLAGEPLHGNLVQALYSNDSVEHVFNLYGPTEDTVYSTVFRAEKQGGTSLPIGRPIANSRAYVLDGYGQPVPVGVPGELYLGGAGLARGYLNRPGLNEEKFIPDPFSDEEGARLYRTGDWVQYRPDGNLVFLRRMDHQVKLRGFRIELGEVEAFLETHPRIRSALAVVREDTPGDKRLIAYVTGKEGKKPEIQALRRYLAQKLPEYMIPGIFIPLDVMPLLPNGKVNRKALPTPDTDSMKSLVAFSPPQTSIERAISDIWCDVLGLDRVGVHNDFF
ncbi:MAG: amino acid adenylation domain-containing protein, partial [Spirochaetota bacterium]|nr:amino acid adenylation domain-containing protein [Spirochaetota bacterium]